MTRRELIIAAALAPLASAKTKKPPNIILFVSDDQGLWRPFAAWKPWCCERLILTHCARKARSSLSFM